MEITQDLTMYLLLLSFLILFKGKLESYPGLESGVLSSRLGYPPTSSLPLGKSVSSSGKMIFMIL